MAVVQGFADGKKWNGVGREVLYWCAYTTPMSPGINGIDHAFRTHERALADFEEESAEIDQFLAPSLAAISVGGR